MAKTMGVGILMELVHNGSCFWFFFSVGSRPVTYKGMLLFHICDWTFALRYPYTLLHSTHPWIFGCFPLDSVISTFVILSIKVLYFSATSSFLSLYFCHTPPQPDQSQYRCPQTAFNRPASLSLQMSVRNLVQFFSRLKTLETCLLCIIITKENKTGKCLWT